MTNDHEEDQVQTETNEPTKKNGKSKGKKNGKAKAPPNLAAAAAPTPPAEKPARKERKPRRQEFLPVEGVAPPVNEAIEEAAIAYQELRDERMEMQVDEREKKQHLHDLLKANGLEVYRYIFNGKVYFARHKVKETAVVEQEKNRRRSKDEED